ncbi:MAG: ABC transporter ATP-binding protein [Lachnospiraceae bacterium]|nr:ABC transporter ATP-binding protein [Lachnospiraceae bacterium]
MNKIIDVKDLCKTYVVNKKQNNVLRNVNFSIDEGEMVGIMGPSGSGKSTLLYTVSGMDKMTAGEVTFNGKNLSKLKENEMADVRLDEMGFIFQQMYMMKNLSILDNIMLPAVKSKKGNCVENTAGNESASTTGGEKSGLPEGNNTVKKSTEARGKKESRKEIRERALSLMHKLGIEDTAQNGINEVSGGQLQRACICRSMINRPRVIFADEPTGALNRTASDEVMDEIVNLNNEGTTVMLVTHDVKVAAKCSRVLYIVDGNIKGEKQLGKCVNPSQVRERERDLNNWLMEMGW